MKLSDPSQGLVADAGTATSVGNAAFPLSDSNAIALTSGTKNDFGVTTATYSDGGATSTTVVRGITLSPTINYTAASKTGKVYLQYLNPTLTSQPSGNNGGIVFSSAFTSSTFPAIRLFNTADEDTNPEWFEMGWHVSSNFFVLRTQKGGTGTARTLSINYGASAANGIQIPASAASPIDIGAVSIGNVAASGRATVGRASSVTATSGTHYDLGIGSGGGPQPTATSTMQYVGLGILPTINYSNATPGAGYVYGIYVNPTNTALPTGRSFGIALSSTASGLTGALCFNNQTDEQTNYEQTTLGYSANIFTISSGKGGTGTARNININFPGTSIAAMGFATNLSSGIIIGFAASNAVAATNGEVIFCNGNSRTATSGVNNCVQVNPSYSDGGSNSSTQSYAVRIAPTINYTAATKTGQVYGIYIAPTNTSLPTGLNAGIAFASTASGLTGAALFHNQSDEVTNYEYIAMGFSSNIFKISSVKGGSGTLRGIQIGISGNSVGFYGVTPAARPSAYTLNATQAPSRTLLASASATVTNNNNVLSQVIQDLQAVGLLQ